ncbi:MAG: hypothetical protein RLN88_00935 [Ekhidna sp.]|uniref:hypothetical protein n=1 Tax=Ekhidna sp. TaxID=2608089 RepID=UPI0032EC95DE
MLKVIIILILIGYVFYRITSFLFSGLFGGFTRHQQFNRRHYSDQPRRSQDSNLNIDNIPGNRAKKGGSFSGGEYVDYEEVK